MALQLTGALIFSGALAAASRLPWDTAQDVGAMLRLSWRHVAPTSQTCRPPREDEIQGVPPHMRPREVCEGGPVPYGLVLVVDGDTLVDRTVSRARERAVSVLDELDVTPGLHRIQVAFRPDSLVAGSRAPALELDERIGFLPGRIVLVTLDGGGLTVVTDAP